MMQIPDPVHGYIALDSMYADIVNTPEFQRLRSIEQVSFRPVYPGARHDRFLHSLGTYHLATKFVDRFFQNLPKDVPGIKVSAAEQSLLETTFRTAALLHDIGHAPFSHTTENFFLGLDPSNPLPPVWKDLCEAVRNVDKWEGRLFSNAQKKSGAPHEIVSALLTVSKWDVLTDPKQRLKVDLPLAARMIIGFPYGPEALDDSHSKQSLGIRNCLIKMLNSSILDVDRLDYMGRDTLMTGFSNAPLDLDALASSVTAVLGDDGWPVPAYRDPALKVFDLMFQAKLSHDAWVIASPAGLYEAALLAHCTRGLNQKIHKDYMSTIFTPDALSREGVKLNGKTYRLLSDVDISADLKAQSGDLYDELYTRELGKRRIAAWRSYYEYHHIFNAPELDVTPDEVYRYFKPLVKYLETTENRPDQNNILVFDAKSYADICKLGNPEILHPADTLRDFLLHAKKNTNDDNYSVVLLDQTYKFAMGLDPAEIRIVFPKLKRFLRANGKNYSTYSELTGVTKNSSPSTGYFYLYRKDGLGHKQLEQLRKKLSKALKDARKRGIL